MPRAHVAPFSALLVALLIGVVLINPAASQTSSAPTPKPGGVLNMMLREDLSQGFAIHETSTISVVWPAMPCFNNLVLFDPLKKTESVETIIGELAEKWSWQDNFRNLVFFLRKNVKWHDGQPFTSKDVKFTFDMLREAPDIAAKLRINPRKDWYANIEAVEAADPYTAVFRLKKPQPSLVLMLASGYTPIYAAHVPPATYRTTCVGTGPFKVKEWVRGSHVEYLRNDSYWNPELPYLDRLVIRWWRDPASRSAAFEAGQLDIGTFNPIPIPDVARLTTGGKIVAETKGYSNSAWVATVEFNQRREIFKKREVRQALMHAIDRQFISDTIFFGRAHPSIGAVHTSNSIFFTKEVQDYPFDVKKAAAMLDAAGYPVKGGSRFKLSLVSAGWFEENVKMGQYVKQAFEDLDITVDLSVPDRATSLKRIYTDYDYDVAISNNSGSIELIPSTTQYYTTDGIVKGAAFRNATGYSNPKLDEIVTRMAVETDEPKRIALAKDFDRFASIEAPILPMVDLEPVTIVRSDVRNHSTTADFMGEGWAEIWLDR